MTNSRQRPDFPHVIDNTMRAIFTACPKKFYWAHMRHLTMRRENIHLTAGKAFAAALDVFRKTYWRDAKGDYDAALLAGFRQLMLSYGFNPELEYDEGWQKNQKSFVNLARAYLHYWHTYHPDTDFLQPLILENGDPAVECSSVLPLEIDHPQTGDPILYSVRYDMLGVHTRYDNALFVVDEKTAGQLGASWAKRWDFRSQFTGYCWSAKQHNRPVAGAIIRGVSPQTYDVKHAQAIVYRPDWMIELWYEQLIRNIRRMIDCWQSGYWDYDMADACTAYGGCEFLDLCTSRFPEKIVGKYHTHVWDPTDPDGKKRNG